MKYFSVLTSIKGKKRATVIEAINKETAIEIARAKKLGLIIKINEIAPPLNIRVQAWMRAFFEFFRGKSKIKLNDLIPAFKQFGMMLNAGISINQSLIDLIEFTENERLEKIFSDVLSGINSGKSLTDSFMPYKDEIGSLSIAMINLGEQTGNLAESLLMLTSALEEIRDNITKLKKATRYPIMVLGSMVLAFIFLINMVVPKFKAIFDRFGASLPLPTKILLGIESAMSNYGLYILLFIIGTIVLILNLYRTNKDFRFEFDKYYLKIYLLGKISYLSVINQYLATLALLLKAGLPLEGALRSASSMVDNSYLKQKLDYIPESIKKGVSLTQSFKDTQLFESSAIQMINAGEQSGNLDEMLQVASNYYKMKYNHIVDNISAYIEPIMTAIIAALITLLALGIFMPMWEMMSAAKGKH